MNMKELSENIEKNTTYVNITVSDAWGEPFFIITTNFNHPLENQAVTIEFNVDDYHRFVDGYAYISPQALIEIEGRIANTVEAHAYEELYKGRNDVLDGSSWNMEIVFKGKHYHYGGINIIPKEFDSLIKYFIQLCGVEMTYKIKVMEQ